MKKARSSSLDSDESHLYLKVRKKLITKLATRVYVPGQRLPSEKELGAEYGVSVATIRQAVGTLEADGIVIRRQGSGTYVWQHQLSKASGMYLRIHDQQNHKINPLRSLLSIKIDSPSDRETKLLDLPPAKQNEVIRYKFLGKNAFQASIFFYVLETVVSHDLFKNLTNKSYFQDESTNLYGLYAEVCGIQVISFEENIYAKALPEEFAPIMGLEAGAPVLYLERVSYTFSKLPVEIRWRYVHPDYHYRVSDR